MGKSIDDLSMGIKHELSRRTSGKNETSIIQRPLNSSVYRTGLLYKLKRKGQIGTDYAYFPLMICQCGIAKSSVGDDGAFLKREKINRLY